MDGVHDGNLLTDAVALKALYGEPSEPAIAKEIDYVHPHYRAMIEAAPFMVMATSGPDGLDVSPRGDPPGFVVVEDDKTLLIPDRRGNNRCDSLNNLIEQYGSVPKARFKEDTGVVQRFQTEEHLTADGKYGPTTAAVIGRLSRRFASAPTSA